MARKTLSSKNEYPERFEKVRGLSLRYILSNNATDPKKPGILFFHGFSFSLDDWRKVGILDRVVDGGYRFLALDLPSGKSSKSDHVTFQKVAEYIPMLDEFLEKVSFSSVKLVLVGPSMGGGFALSYAIAHPNIVAGLVLISPSLKSIGEEEIEEIRTPSMLVWGERDNVFPIEEYGKRLKNTMTHSKLVIIKGAGHAAYLDKPSEFNDLMLDFLDEISE